MREKSTGFVILGILAVGGELSGYDIRQWIEQAVGFFWSESFGQIYPELKRLADAKLIKAADGVGRRRRAKRFRITAKGREELRRWLARTPRLDRPRNELLLKLFFGSVIGVDGVRALLAGAARVLEERVTAIEAAEALVIREDRTADHLVFSLITILSGQTIFNARLAWAAAAQELLDAREAGGNEAVLRAYGRIKRSSIGGKQR